jgi:flagellin
MQADLDALAEGAEEAPFDFVVSVEDGSIRIDELNGYAFGVSSFTSESNGTAIVRSGYGQESVSGLSMAVLDDTERANSASTLGAGLASETTVDLVFDALSADQETDDTYSFTISDGVRSARITNVTREGTAGDSVMLSAINSALILSGMDDVMTAEATTGVDGGITLTHTLGRTISITDFTSTSDTAVSVRGGTNADGDLSTGIARYLDDNYDSANGSVVRDIDVTTASRAQDAIDVLDYAINDVATERANLGAIQNRLNHTINNLTNISVNTEASRSRIMDADYGQESANLAKAQIIQQAATAMLAQANQQPQSVLSLLQ